MKKSWEMKAREMEKKISRQTRLPKAPDRREADQQARTASRAAAAPNQSPHTEAVLVPERRNSRTVCPRMRSAAAASADARYFNIAGTGPPRLASNQTLLHRSYCVWSIQQPYRHFCLVLLYCAAPRVPRKTHHVPWSGRPHSAIFSNSTTLSIRRNHI
jgi:hypothetical protein